MQSQQGYCAEMHLSLPSSDTKTRTHVTSWSCLEPEEHGYITGVKNIQMKSE